MNPIDRDVAKILSDCPLKNLTPQEEQSIHVAIEKRADEIQHVLNVWENQRSRNVEKGNSGRHQMFSHGQQVDLLEVYCEPNSQLAQQVNARGGRATRFSMTDGDLSTPHGVQKLWTWVLMYEPRHIWVAPECRLWGMFSRYNMGRGPFLFKKIQGERKKGKMSSSIVQ